MDQTSAQSESMKLGIGDLAAARLIRAAAISARTAGSIDSPLQVLSDAELSAPILESDADFYERKPLGIRGYNVISEIGSGGQATVYRGSQESTGRQVAIKVIPGGPFISSRRRARFELEAKLLAGFNHPNIVDILDRGRTDDGSFFIVMELIEGPPLDLYWKQLQPQPETLARLFVKIAGAVEEAHKRGIVHRDLKPSNVRVDERGEPHVLDFGLARMTDWNTDDPKHKSITDFGQIVGSLPWASPEQARHGEDAVDARSDVYSLGVMLFELIAGKPPYKIDGSLSDTLKNIATSTPIAPSKAHSPKTRKGFWVLDGITLKALAKNPAGRYASAGRLADDLENYLSGKPISLPKRKRLGRLLCSICAVTAAVSCAVYGPSFLRQANVTSQPSVANLPRFDDARGITFVRIPAGVGWIGSRVWEIGRGTDETLHEVKIDRPFWITSTEITQEQFRTIMGFNPSDPRYLGKSLPVQCVTWDEAQDFCRRLGLANHHACRLPSEAEWEYACRATEITAFTNGHTLDQLGWWKGNSENRLHSVATKQSNFWGLYDMNGGVAEWCLDAYRPYCSSLGAVRAVAEASADRVIRGGSFLSDASRCRAAARSKAPPDTRSPEVGFRVVFADSAVSAEK